MHRKINHNIQICFSLHTNSICDSSLRKYKKRQLRCYQIVLQKEKQDNRCRCSNQQMFKHCKQSDSWVWSHRHLVSHLGTAICLQRGHTSPPIPHLHLQQLWSQPHCHAEPDSSLNWQRFRYLPRSTGILWVTSCTAAAIFQKCVNMFEIWQSDTSEVHIVLVKRRLVRRGVDSQTEAYCEHSSCFLNKQTAWKLYKNTTVTLKISSRV